MVELHGERTLLKGPVQFHFLRRMFDTNVVLRCFILTIEGASFSQPTGLPKDKAFYYVMLKYFRSHKDCHHLDHMTMLSHCKQGLQLF